MAWMLHVIPVIVLLFCISPAKVEARAENVAEEGWYWIMFCCSTLCYCACGIGIAYLACYNPSESPPTTVVVHGGQQPNPYFPANGQPPSYGTSPPPQYRPNSPPQFGANPPPQFGTSPLQPFGANLPPQFGTSPPQQLGANPPPQFETSPPPQFGASPPYCLGASPA